MSAVFLPKIVAIPNSDTYLLSYSNFKFVSIYLVDPYIY